MKKIIFIILLLCVFITGIQSIAATEDVEPPVLTSIVTHKKSLYGGEKLGFSINGQDDLTGLDNIMIEYVLSTNNSKRISIELKNTSTSNQFSGSYLMPEKTAPGLWKATVIQLWDGAGNLAIYHPNTNPSIDFSSLNFTVLEKVGTDTKPPILNDVSVSNKVIKAPGKFVVTVSASDDYTKTIDVQVTYEIRKEQVISKAVKKSNNKYDAEFHVDENAKYQPAKFLYIILKDDAGNEAWYSYTPSEYPFGEASLKLNKNIDVSFSNTIPDVQAPILQNYTYSHQDVSVPGSVQIIFEATDDVSGVASIKAHFKGYDQNDKMIDYALLYPTYNSKSKKFISEYVFDQYNPQAVFFIEEIEITDGAGNVSIYSINPSQGKRSLKKKEMRLKKAVTSDISTGTMKDDYVETVAKAKSDASISIDCTKNNIVDEKVFSHIKGTQKQLILINDGIQWIFKGADINNPIKKVDTKIDIFTFDKFGNNNLIDYFIDDSKGIIIQFASNGLLPGKALIKIKADYTFRNYIGDKELYIYHYLESENGLESIAEKINMTSDGYYEFYILHNSKYIISKGPAKETAIVKNSSQALNHKKEKDIKENHNNLNLQTQERNKILKNTSSSYMYLYIIGGCIVFLLGLGVIFRKQFIQKYYQLRRRKE